MNLGDFTPGKTIRKRFNTHKSDGTPVTLAGSPAVSVYKGSTTESTAGVTLTVDYDSRTGLHDVVIDTSADGTFYAAGNDFDVVITTGTVDSISVVGTVVGTFSLSNRSALRPTTADRTLDVSTGGEAGVDWANVGSPTTTLALTGTTIATTQKVDVETIKTRAVTCAADVTVGVYVGGTGAAALASTALSTAVWTAPPTGFLAATFPGTVASTTNITAGTITTATNLTNLPSIPANWITAAGVADGAIDRATFAADTGLQTVRSNTAQAGGNNTITLDASASSTTNYYQGCRVYLTGGTGVGQSGLVISYNGTTKVCTMFANWVTNPDNTTTFAIEKREDVYYTSSVTTLDYFSTSALQALFDTDSGLTYGSAVAGSVVKEIADNAGGGTPPSAADIATEVRSRFIVRTNTAQAGGASSITLDASASATNDFYNGDWVYIKSGTGAGQAQCIFDYVGSTKVATTGTWLTQPDNTSVFEIIPQAEVLNVGFVGQVAGYVSADLYKIKGTTLTETSAGYLAAGMSYFFDVVTPAETMNDVGGTTPPTASEIADEVETRTLNVNVADIDAAALALFVNTDTTLDRTDIVAGSVADIIADQVEHQDNPVLATSVRTAVGLSAADLGSRLTDIATWTLSTYSDTPPALAGIYADTQQIRNVGVNVTDIDAAALELFFTVDTGSVYGDAVAGSVVKEIVSHANEFDVADNLVVDTGASTTVVPTDSTKATNYYNKQTFYCRSGTNAGLTNRCSTYSNTAGTLTFSRAWPATPGAGDVFVCMGAIEDA